MVGGLGNIGGGTTCASLLMEVSIAGAAITAAPAVLKNVRLDSLGGQLGWLSWVTSYSLSFMIFSSITTYFYRVITDYMGSSRDWFLCFPLRTTDPYRTQNQWDRSQYSRLFIK